MREFLGILVTGLVVTAIVLGGFYAILGSYKYRIYTSYKSYYCNDYIEDTHLYLKGCWGDEVTIHSSVNYRIEEQ